jgi:hypothetical protein
VSGVDAELDAWVTENTLWLLGVMITELRALRDPVDPRHQRLSEAISALQEVQAELLGEAGTSSSATAREGHPPRCKPARGDSETTMNDEPEHEEMMD